MEPREARGVAAPTWRQYERPMKRDSRLSIVLHTLLHMADAGAPLTSELLAERMGTHPVFVRRTLGGLRRAGIVQSERGRGGGWTFVRALADVTLADVYEALGEPTILAMGNRTENPGCVVEQAVNRATGALFSLLEEGLREGLRRTTLADLARDTRGRLTGGGAGTAKVPATGEGSPRSEPVRTDA